MENILVPLVNSNVLLECNLHNKVCVLLAFIINIMVFFKTFLTHKFYTLRSVLNQKRFSNVILPDTIEGMSLAKEFNISVARREILKERERDENFSLRHKI
jgi:hypothetical protein